VFQKAPLSDLCLEIAGSSEIQSCAPMFLSDHLVSEGALSKLGLLILAENVMEAKI
jgi:hypothetical protein